jgi:hypothetical protein
VDKYIPPLNVTLLHYICSSEEMRAIALWMLNLNHIFLHSVSPRFTECTSAVLQSASMCIKDLARLDLDTQTGNRLARKECSWPLLFWGGGKPHHLQPRGFEDAF